MMPDDLDLPVPFSNPTTSLSAAQAMRASGAATTQAARILAALRAALPQGLTFYEIQRAVNLEPGLPEVGIRQVTARTNALVKAGYAKDSGVTRRSDSGHANTVWIAVEGEPVPLVPGAQTHGRVAAALRRERDRYRTLEDQHFFVLQSFARGEFINRAGLEAALALERRAVLRLIEAAFAERWTRERLRAAVAQRDEPALALEAPPDLPSLAAAVQIGSYLFTKRAAGVDAWEVTAPSDREQPRLGAPLLEVLATLARRPAMREG